MGGTKKMKKSFKDRLSYLGLSLQKELLIIFAIATIFITSSILLIVLLKETYLGIIVFITGAILELLYTSRYKTIEDGINKDRVYEFIFVLPYFELFISNGNDVYLSFNLLIPYCGQFLQDAISAFLIQSEEDKTLNPFICFAKKFEDSVVQTLMLAIYRIKNSGDLLEFDLLFQNTKDKCNEDLIESKKKSLDSFNSYPLIGAGAITVLFAFQVLSVIGDYVNVI